MKVRFLIDTFDSTACTMFRARQEYDIDKDTYERCKGKVYPHLEAIDEAAPEPSLLTEALELGIKYAAKMKPDTLAAAIAEKKAEIAENKARTEAAKKEGL